MNFLTFAKSVDRFSFRQTGFLAPCHTSRERKSIANSLKRPNPCNLKRHPGFWCLRHMLVESLTGLFHAQRVQGSTSVFSHATSNQLTTLSARYLDDDTKHFLLGPTQMSLNWTSFQRSRRECSNSKLSLQCLY